MTLVSGAAKYDGKLDKGNIRYNTTKTWQNAHSEYSRHVQKWWGGKRYKFYWFAKAIKLVALIKPSNAPDERLFFRLKSILKTIGKNSLHDNIEARLMKRFNKNTSNTVNNVFHADLKHSKLEYKSKYSLKR